MPGLLHVHEPGQLVEFVRRLPTARVADATLRPLSSAVVRVNASAHNHVTEPDLRTQGTRYSDEQDCGRSEHPDRALGHNGRGMIALSRYGHRYRPLAYRSDSEMRTGFMSDDPFLREV
jgi:hypothetical protein